MELFTYEKGGNNDTFALGCFGIVLFILSPLIIGNIGTQIAKSGGQPCSEGTDCIWSLIPSYADYTVPFGGLLLLLYIPMWLVTNYEVTETKENEPHLIEDSNDSDEA